MDTTSKHHPSSQRFPAGAQSGQAIIIIAVMMIGLIGSLGLAIDGGGLFFLRRDTQNAVDAALLAAAYAQCAIDPEVAKTMDPQDITDDIHEAALDAAARNNFEDTDPGVNTTNAIDVQVHRGPTTGPKAGDQAYVEVIIRANKPSYFIQLVWGGQLSATSRGVSYCQAAHSTVPLAAMMALGNCGPHFDEFAMNGSNSTLESGGAASGGNIVVSGSNGSNAAENQMNGGVVAVDDIDLAASYYPLDEPETEGADPSTITDSLGLHVEDFTTGRIGRNLPSGMLHIWGDDPGETALKWDLSGQSGLEGVYVNIHDSVEAEIDLKNATWDDSGSTGATFVTHGVIDFHAQAGHTYNYYSGLLTTDDGTAGILFFSEKTPANPCNNGSNVGIKIRGKAGNDCDQGNPSSDECTFVRGVIYAPHSQITWSSARANFYGAIIGDTLDGQAADFHFTYVESLFPPVPPMLEMAE